MSGLPVNWDAVQIAQGVKRPGVALPRYRNGVRDVPQYPACVLDATRVIYRALNVHHTTARMAAIALWREGLL